MSDAKLTEEVHRFPWIHNSNSLRNLLLYGWTVKEANRTSPSCQNGPLRRVTRATCLWPRPKMRSERLDKRGRSTSQFSRTWNNGAQLARQELAGALAKRLALA